MHRQPLLKLLAGYLTENPSEAATVAKITDLVRQAPDCFERSCRPGHITGSAWILSHDHQACLLVHHRKLNRWLQPGGHADGQTDVAAVALREAQEESGLQYLEIQQRGGGLVSPAPLLPLDVDVHEIPARFDDAGNILEDAHEHHDIRFMIVAATGQPLVLSEESHDLRWFSHEQLLSITDEASLLRMMHKAGPFA